MRGSAPTTRFRFWLWLIRLIGVIVPRRLRADFRQEWEAELSYREAMFARWERLDWRTKLDLLRRSTSAFWDAMWLQTYRWEDEMIQDLRYGVRMLLKNPGFTLAALLSLGIGIGANSAVFSVVNGVVLRPLPYNEPERLVRIWHEKPSAGMTQMPVNAGSVVEWRDHSQSFAGVAAYSTTTAVFTGEGEPEQIAGAKISADLFPLLGLQPLVGRSFTREENQRGNDKVIILSYGLWQRRFGADPSIIGRALTLDHTSTYTVIGVMPAGAVFPGQSQFWMPEVATASARHDMRGSSVIARLKPGVSLQQAAQEVELINQRLQQQYPGDYEGWGVRLVTLHESVVGEVRRALLVLFGAVGFVLLIACANVANLLLSRAAAREKELSVRAALGASRLRLIRQMLTEGLLLCLLASGFGLLLAQLGVRALMILRPPDLPRLDQIGVDGGVFAFTLGTALLSGLVFGLIPALRFSKPDIHHSLKASAARSGAGGGRRQRYGLRGLLIVAQTALAIVLLAGAGLMIRSFVKLRQVELGFEPSGAVALTIAPPLNRFTKDQTARDYYQRMLDALRTVPGVSAAAVMTGMPTGGALMISDIVIAGRPAPTESNAQRAIVNIVSADYFRAILNPLRQGRLFTDGDDQSAPLSAVINETMARTFFAGTNPVGQRIGLRGERDKLYEVIGVVADVKQFGVDEETRPAVYLSFLQREMARMNLVVRTTVDPATLIPALRGRISEVDRFTPVTSIRTLEEQVAQSTGQRRFYMLLLALFAGIAVVLAGIGIYGVLSYTVARRTHEIGIRMALGSERGGIMRLIVGEGLRLVLTGGVSGLIAAFVLTRLMESLLFGVSAHDPLTFASIFAALIAVGLFACYLPARRATRIDPLVALRQE